MSYEMEKKKKTIYMLQRRHSEAMFCSVLTTFHMLRSSQTLEAITRHANKLGSKNIKDTIYDITVRISEMLLICYHDLIWRVFCKLVLLAVEQLSTQAILVYD